MTKDEEEYVNSTINKEGFDYCFVHYAGFEEISDKKFHELRLAYLKAEEELREYLNYEPQ